jgi:hypothetical protein
MRSHSAFRHLIFAGYAALVVGALVRPALADDAQRVGPVGAGSIVSSHEEPEQHPGALQRGRLLIGTPAIAVYLGIRQEQAEQLIAERTLPTFMLDGRVSAWSHELTAGPKQIAAGD